MDPKIEQFLLELPDPKRNLALQVRDIMLSAGASLKEAIKWNQLTFVLGKANIGFIYTKPESDYISLAFFKATSLYDPKNLFEGTGKGMRHIKIREERDIPIEEIERWVTKSILLETKVNRE